MTNTPLTRDEISDYLIKHYSMEESPTVFKLCGMARAYLDLRDKLSNGELDGKTVHY